MTSKNVLDSESKVGMYFYRVPTLSFPYSKALLSKYKYILIPKQQYSVFSALPGKQIFENFSQSLEAVTSVVLLMQMVGSLHHSREPETLQQTGGSKKRLLLAVSREIFPKRSRNCEEVFLPTATQHWGSSGFSLATMVSAVS